MTSLLARLHRRSFPKGTQVDCKGRQRRSEVQFLKTLTKAKRNSESLSRTIFFGRKNKLSAFEPISARNFRRYYGHMVRSYLTFRHNISHRLPISQPTIYLQYFRPNPPCPGVLVPANLRGGAIEFRTRKT